MKEGILHLNVDNKKIGILNNMGLWIVEGLKLNLKSNILDMKNIKIRKDWGIFDFFNRRHT